ncbi:MAG: iron-containing alcohol dehydrogenase [Sedimentisphaerales bacterium]|nr:iron-containing alcohol dehydrogenase [Sedimentisphaerales bacterium]
MATLMKFEFATATRILFGSGMVRDVPSLSVELGKRACVVTGRTGERAQSLLDQLKTHGIESLTCHVDGEPTTESAKAAVETARSGQCDLVISIGGGSVLDTGKVVAAMLTNTGKLENYLEVVGPGEALTQVAAPHIAIPTTAGTGAEVTRNAVLGVPEYQVKVSMRSPLMLPCIALVDPDLTHSMPSSITATTGLDALTQLIEVYVSNKANPLTDGLCREGLKRAGRSLRRAYQDGVHSSAREDMAVASLFSGLGLANAKLGAVHGFAGPLGGMLSAPHGAVCARLLPFVMETNVRALQSRKPDSEILSRYDDVAQLLTRRTTAKANDGVKWVQDLCATLNVPSLTEFGLAEREFSTAVAKARKSSSMKGNPIELTESELLEILKKACSRTK